MVINREKGLKLLKYSATTDDFCFKFYQILGCDWNQAQFLIEHIDGQVTQTYLLSYVYQSPENPQSWIENSGS